MKKLIDKFNLAGKTALVTGGASGIGLSFSRILAEAGATVMMAARTEERLKMAARMLSDETGSTVLQATVDLSDRADAERLITHARETMGGVDIFVGNAGTEVMETVEHLKDESIDRILAVNLVSNIVMTRALVPDMKKKQWGRIIYISSTTAMMASKHVGHSIYTTSKSALHGFAQVVAVEVAMDGITVNCIAPGVTMTEMVSDAIKQFCKTPKEADDFIKYNASVTAVNRWAQPEEMAGTLLLLASDAGSYITGAVYIVDGGQTVVMDPVVRL